MKPRIITGNGMPRIKPNKKPPEIDQGGFFTKLCYWVSRDFSYNVQKAILLSTRRPNPLIQHLPGLRFYRKIQGEIQFETDIPAHIIDTVAGVGIRRRIEEIFQPAEMIVISDVEKVVAVQVKVEDGFSLLIGKAPSYPRIEKAIAGRRRLGIV